MTYTQLLAGRGLKIGDQVICDYRMPTAHQWWHHPLWVGVIEPVGTDPKEWNGSNSEEHFCVLLVRVKVRYLAADGMEGHTQHDDLGHLRKLEFGDVTASPRFGSDGRGYDALREFAGRAGFSYPRRHAAVGVMRCAA